ncbi:MAG: hypothetical protein Q8S00_03005 [Deltaproteobacteria bacterium]|nr:hypothetical protein [Deltaproteobacteria bacterium]
MGKFIHQARLSHSRLAYESECLAMSSARLLQHSVEDFDFVTPSYESRKAARDGGIQTLADGSDTDQGVSFNWIRKTFDRNASQGFDPHETFDFPEGSAGHSNRTRRRDFFHPRCQVGTLTNGGIIDIHVTADRAHYDLTRVKSHRDLQFVGAEDFLGVAPYFFLHAERRITGA